MADLKYDDFLDRIDIQDLLVDAGYRLNKRDGMRYPSYVLLDSAGRRVKGDKFLVTPNGKCCFQPPSTLKYNVIGFIKDHPHLFAEYSPSMSKDRLVNLVCNRLLNNPIEERASVRLNRERVECKFNIDDYERLNFDRNVFASQKAFYFYFKDRGINLDTQRAFADNFFIAIKDASNGKTYTNLSFPLRKPNNLNEFVGLEERGKFNAETKKSFKGMAAGSNACEGLWIACPAGRELSRAKDVYWFESGYDAMSFYQIKKSAIRSEMEANSTNEKVIKNCDRQLRDLNRSVFVSTGGNPSIQQFKGMMQQTADAHHHLCFDRDMAGRMFAVNFLLAKNNSDYKINLKDKDCPVIVTPEANYFFPFNDYFDLNEIAKNLNLETSMHSHSMSKYMMSLRNDSIHSGDEDLLPAQLGDLFGTYQFAAEEYESARYSGLVCSEDLAEYGKELRTAYEEYDQALKTAVAEYLKATASKVIYEPCEADYKDWNDQLQDKKAYSQTDEIETAFDVDYGNPVIEHEEEYEEKNKKDESEETERKRFFFHR